MWNSLPSSLFFYPLLHLGCMTAVIGCLGTVNTDSPLGNLSLSHTHTHAHTLVCISSSLLIKLLNASHLAVCYTPIPNQNLFMQILVFILILSSVVFFATGGAPMCTARAPRVDPTGRLQTKDETVGDLERGARFSAKGNQLLPSDLKKYPQCNGARVTRWIKRTTITQSLIYAFIFVV